MKVYKDVFSNDEVMSESFNYTVDYDDVIMKVKSQYKSKENAGKVDIGKYIV
jgi:hypothetical protein